METELVQIVAPKLPPKWRYTEIRRPRDKEFYAVSGEIFQSSGRQAMPYPIVVRESEG